MTSTPPTRSSSTTAASPTSATPRRPRRLADGAEEVDLGGAAVLPGLIDPHSHFTGALQYLLYADLSECTSFDEITETLKKFAAERNIGPDGVIMGNGYDQNNLVEQRHPDKSIPNAVSTDVPCSSRTCPTTWAWPTTACSSWPASRRRHPIRTVAATGASTVRAIWTATPRSRRP